MNTRKPTWRADLLAYLTASARDEFRVGTNDCALFAAGAVKVMTGKDLAKGWRGKYRSLAKGKALLKKEGFADLAELSAHHFEEIPPLMAQVGDVAIVEGDDDPALGIVQGASVWVRMPSGIGSVPLTEVKRAFRV